MDTGERPRAAGGARRVAAAAVLAAAASIALCACGGATGASTAVGPTERPFGAPHEGPGLAAEPALAGFPLDEVPLTGDWLVTIDARTGCSGSYLVHRGWRVEVAPGGEEAHDDATLALRLAGFTDHTRHVDGQDGSTGVRVLTRTDGYSVVLERGSERLVYEISLRPHTYAPSDECRNG